MKKTNLNIVFEAIWWGNFYFLFFEWSFQEQSIREETAHLLSYKEG